MQLKRINLKIFSLLITFFILSACFNTKYEKIVEKNLNTAERQSKKDLDALYKAYYEQLYATEQLNNNNIKLNTISNKLIATTTLINLFPTLENVYNLLVLSTPLSELSNALLSNPMGNTIADQSIIFINEPIKLINYDEIQNICLLTYNKNYQFALLLNGEDKSCNNYTNNIIIKKQAGIYSYTNSTSNIISVDSYALLVKPTEVQLKYYNVLKPTLSSLSNVDVVIDKDLLNNNYLLKSKYIVYLRHINDYANNQKYKNYYNHYNFLINKHLMLKELFNIYQTQQSLLLAKVENANKGMEAINSMDWLVYKNKNNAISSTTYCDKITFICLKMESSNSKVNFENDKKIDLKQEFVKQNIYLDFPATIAYLLTFPISIPISVILLLTTDNSPFIIDEK